MPDGHSEQVLSVQHGIDGRREQSQVTKPCGATIIQEPSNPLDLTWGEPISLPGNEALIPGLPFLKAILS